MTKNNHREKIKKFSARQTVFAFMSVFSLALILRNSDVAVEYMAKGLKLCASTVIPSLFPFMVVSSFIVSGPVADAAGRALRLPMKFLFGTGGKGGCAVILGALCGFPVGTKSAVGLYDSGKISKSELEHLLTFCNNPSSAFMISAVGMSVFGCREFGAALYLCTLSSAALIGIVGNIIRKIKGKKFPGEAREENKFEKKENRTLDFTGIITSSASGMLNVCAFVVFFSAFVGTLSHMLNTLNFTPAATSLVFGFFELTVGIAESGNIAPVESAVLTAAFIAGWSGMSVHFQIMSLCENRGINFKPYFIAKVFHGLLNVFMFKLYNIIYKPQFSFFSDTVPAGFFEGNVYDIFKILSVLTFLICAAYLIKLKFRPVK